MAKEASKSCREDAGMPGVSPVNTGDPDLEYAFYLAERRVLEIQAKLHRWARDDPHRRFDDLFNLVADPAFLLVGWARVRGNKGAKTAGVDGRTAVSIEARGVEEFLGALRDCLKDRSFCPLPSRERLIPKPGTARRRRLGISTIRDRVVQASLKLVLEPVFEADFLPCSYGFRPGRRVHDAVAEVRHLTSCSYEWIVEGDIKACFDEISHCALLDRVRARVGDKRVLALVKAFLKAGILTEDRRWQETSTGTPQGSILSPLLSNVALSVLDEHVAAGPGGPAASPWQRAKRRAHGLPNYRLSRYADDWCLMVHGTRDDAAALDRLLPLRRVACHLQLPARLSLAPGHRVAAAQIPPEQLEGTPPRCLRRRLVARHTGGDLVRPGKGADHPLPVPGRQDPHPVARRCGLRAHRPPGLAERPLPGNGHGGCGGRPGETGRS